jgi:hypothetical protein
MPALSFVEGQPQPNAGYLAVPVSDTVFAVALLKMFSVAGFEPVP